MANLPKNVLAWFPQGASPPQAVGVFSLPGSSKFQKMWEYRELLADRVQWMLENSDPDDLRLANAHLEALGLEAGLEPEELVAAVRAGVLDERLSVLGVNPPQKGRHESPEFLKEVFLLEWASSLGGGRRGAPAAAPAAAPSLDNFTDAELDATIAAALGTTTAGPPSSPNPDPAPVPPPPPTAGQAAASVAANVTEAIDQALTELFKILGGGQPGTLGSARSSTRTPKGRHGRTFSRRGRR